MQLWGKHSTYTAFLLVLWLFLDLNLLENKSTGPERGKNII